MNFTTEKKKIVALTILVMLISLFMPIISNAESAFAGKLSISSATGKVNGTVTIEVKTTQEVDASEGAGFLVQYDHEKLQADEEKTEVANLNGFSVISGDSENGYGVQIAWAGRGDGKIPAGTVLTSIVFNVLPVAAGDIPLTVINDVSTDRTQLATGKVHVDVSATVIKLDKNSLALNIADNKTGTLTATIEPANSTDKTITWKSSNEAVAKVSGEGTTATVTAISKGTANITATINGKTATCSVAVSAAPLKSVTLSEVPTDVLKGKEFKFKVTPNEGAEIAK